jgi:PAS domain S-box-containing protein
MLSSELYTESSAEAWTKKVSTDCSCNGSEFHKELIQAALQLTTDAIIIIDSSSSVVLLNSMAENITGWKSCDAKFLPISEIFPLNNIKDDRSIVKILERTLTENHKTNIVDDAILNIHNSHSLLIEYSIHPIYKKDRKDTIGAALMG